MMSDAHHFSLRVYYEDTDFSGNVYHANYLKYCERARSGYLRDVGVDQTAMFAEGTAFVVRRMASFCGLRISMTCWMWKRGWSKCPARGLNWHRL
jgi:hypothetical protein